MKPYAIIFLLVSEINNIDKMKNFYNLVLGFRIENDLGNYVEFENDGVRFAIYMRDVIYIAESRRDEWNRLLPFFNELMSNEYENIIIVSHGDLLSVFNAMCC